MPPNGSALSPASTDLMLSNQIVVETWIPLKAGRTKRAATLINFWRSHGYPQNAPNETSSC
jgi:hypothetical protein